MKTLPIRPVPPTPGGQRPGADGPPVDRRWTVARLLTAPHRLGFFSAALMLATSALWWAVALVARQAGLALPWAVPPAVAHGLLMGMGNMPLFIVGFLFTAGPRWLGLPDVAARSLRWPVVAMLCGWAVALIGFHAHALVAALGIAAVAGGWSAIVVHFVGLVRRSPVADQLHARVIAAAAALGALALWAAAAGLATDQATAVRVATQAALWGCLAPVFWTVSHRMIPFFSASALPLLDAWRPNWLLWVGLAALAVAGAGAVADLLWWPLPPAVRWAQLALEAPAAALMLWLAVRWGLVQSLKIRLLAMLHGGFVWLGLALSLAAVSHGLQASGTSAVGLGLAPTHALTMGYLGCTLIAMITRVAAGHSGRPLAADNVAWALYWGLQTATLLRLGAVLWPAAEGPLVLLAVAAWAAATTGWAWRYGGWLGRPRIDGRPG
ncbi:MAG: hypothetical protein A3E25_22880 [Burkholderiales bacterium RIFCSPHIGHO2_12_FULL_69_20]|nr:MAG: hypothetical protein A3E25_22880 [Burkholderiales bacterium RIFCSPHIGHO2_12_FULL_69_20]